MTQPTIKRLLCFLMLFLACGAAQAATVQWTLTDIVFSDGGTATGSFRYDADSNTYSNVDVLTSAGADSSGFAYDSVLEGDGNFVALLQSPGADLTGEPILQLVFQTPLTNSGGLVSLASFLFPPGPPTEGICLDAACDKAQMDRFTSEGGLVGTVVPAPPALILLLSAVGALLSFGRRSA